MMKKASNSYLFCKLCNKKSTANPTSECWEYLECSKCYHQGTARSNIKPIGQVQTASFHYGIINQYLDSGMYFALKEIHKYDS
jgi:hypothetical protein